MRWLSTRSARGVVVALATTLAFLAAWLLAAPLPAAAAGDPVAQEHELLALVNAERAAHGAGPLAMQTDLVVAARLHAASMRDAGAISHDLDGKKVAAPAGWNRLGENVGTGSDMPSLHAAFMASPSHAENVLQPAFDWAGIGVAHAPDGRIYVVVVFMAHPSLRAAGATPPDSSPAPSAPAPPPVPAPAPAPAPTPIPPRPAPVGVATVPPSDRGSWRATPDGHVVASGGAGHYGSAAGLPLRGPVVGLVPTPTGRGYWLVASDGGVFAFGDARFHGSAGALTLDQPVVGMAATRTGRGYWLVAADGGVFTFGDARFFGSTGGRPIGAPIRRIVAGPADAGYWLLASDGSGHAFGAAGPRPAA